MDHLRSRSTDDYVVHSHRSQSTTAPDAPNRPRSPPALVRSQTYPRDGSYHTSPLSSVASSSRSQPTSLEQGRRHSATNGTIRQPCRRLSLPNGLVERLASCSETSTSSGSTPPSSPRRTLADVRNAVRAKQTEKIVQARAVMKRRLADYCAVSEQRAQSADVAS
ncbi:hypothetical protein T484DRAFT_1755646 [Baffinella frigidus]|jgi:hypothetical protein|nr:hypothetical protein T484DRAFT_1755646 [Cryptophyta sp. CCMP2293]